MSQNNINPTAIELSEQELDEVAGGAFAQAIASGGSVAISEAFGDGVAISNAKNGSKAIAIDKGSEYFHGYGKKYYS